MVTSLSCSFSVAVLPVVSCHGQNSTERHIQLSCLMTSSCVYRSVVSLATHYFKKRLYGMVADIRNLRMMGQRQNLERPAALSSK
ncbi:hypothetical protein F5148DRAFT_730504 [Russula earlei]|uniref:Uncharacterized protein n=1 Tax=Russula earlei TaxID=71964 RepID=A0ACC0UN28_9AGAM|nr:hypothetical protein F5148DRAFT_730504 [Russula earlei]